MSAAAGASAQLEAGEDTGADTIFTPVAADDHPAWIQIAGARFGFDSYPARSATPVGAELYAVTFENDTHGFAAGAQCKVAPPTGMTGDALRDYLDACSRAPVIYEYTKTETEETWELALPPVGDGYVGAIAFMPGGRAMAVGGTGSYPKREERELDPMTSTGDARAWLYQNGVWTQVTNAQMLPGMRGLTAVAFSDRVGDCADDRGECGLAGGYRQMWEWKDGAFVTGWDTASQNPAAAADAPIDDRDSFRFRVREIAFTPAGGATKAIAVTSGCCDTTVTNNVPSALVFDGTKLWAKEYSAVQDSQGSDPVAGGPHVPGDDPTVRRDIPDSFYAFTINKEGVMSLLATPGGDPEDGSVPERPSRVYGNIAVPEPSADSGFGGAVPSTLKLAEDMPAISTMRLLSGDGTFQASSQAGQFMDWAVGSLADEQGVAYYVDADVSPTRQVPSPSVLTCDGGGWPQITNPAPPDTRCQPYEVPQGYLDQVKSDYLFRLPSYGLNAMAFTDSTQAIGWAVGDRGAILRLGGIGTSSAVGGEPEPAKVGTGTLAPFRGGDVYAAFRPMPTDGDTAPVPSRASRGTTRVERAEFVADGAPNPAIPAHPSYAPEDASSVVMSPDGSEGWAVGAGGGEFTRGSLPLKHPAPTVYHYDGLRWAHCDIRGVPGLLPADPACQSLRDLFGNSVGGLENALLRFAARIPVENDDDPSNDGDFEVFAIGTQWDPPGPVSRAPVVLRYRNGTWAPDDVAMTQLGLGGLNLFEPTSVAFTAPNDGWITSKSGVRLAHWDGEKWSNCDVAGAADLCGDGRDRLSLDAPDAFVTAAGKRVYFASSRNQGGTLGGAAGIWPVILHKDPGGEWTAANGGYDPSCDDSQPGCAAAPAEPEQQGPVLSMAVSPDLRHGWAIGEFGAGSNERAVGSLTAEATDNVTGPPYNLLRLQNGVWTPYREDDAARDYLTRARSRRQQPVFLDSAGTAAIHGVDTTTDGPGVLMFDPKRGQAGRWRVLQLPYSTIPGGQREANGLTRALVPDGDGGAWLAAKQDVTNGLERQAVHFWHYTKDVPKPVFEEAPHPIRERITGSAAAADGSFWVTTNSAFVYRYDRLTGWDRLQIPGWDRGRLVTRASEARAVAVGPDGEGLVVGKNGRIADISALGVKLNPAAGKRCGTPPCGTGHDLLAAAVAPDGSALVGGDASVLLYKPVGEPFRRIQFGGSEKASITGISMPTPDRAWLVNTAGQVYVGTRAAADKWTFFVESRTPQGRLLSFDENGALLALRGVAVDADGEGYAVGDRGLVLERRGDGSWQRLKTGFLDQLRSVTLAPGGRDRGALIGGEMGLILTLEDGEFRVAREADFFDPVNWGRSGSSLSARVLGVAIMRGTEAGETEAWAVQQSQGGPGVVLHYASDPNNLLLRPGSRITPLRDTPEPREGEISFAAFGRTECHAIAQRCAESESSHLFHEAVSRRVADSVIARSDEAGGPDFAIFTGDVGRAAGKERRPGTGSAVNSSLDRSYVHRRWTELVADRFADAGVPLFGAIGRNDLDRTAVCSTPGGSCEADLNSTAGAGLTWGWRKALAGMPAPWGVPGNDNPPAQTGDYSFDPVGETTGSEDPVAGGARTHYAVDLKRAGTLVARLIFLDNSMGTLASSDPNQNPIEPGGGQLTWLNGMLAGVDEDAGQQAIVVMNTPTYSYQAGDPTTWAGDATPLETTFMQNDVKMVVSGRLGWNGRYWASAPGLHAPCPGQPYRGDDEYPRAGDPPCEEQTGGATDPANQVSEQLADAMQGLGAPAPPGEGDSSPIPGSQDAPEAGLQGLLPMVVAASAGGRFGPNGTDGGEARNGWWHGYTIVRMDESGDPRKTIVEQRPVFDWISITAPSHVLKPRQRLRLIGEGREPVGVDAPPRYDRIDSDAITHRYDLVRADEQNPSLPARDANGNYIPLPPDCRVGCVDRETGVVTAGAGRQNRVYAVAILSVGDKAASWPIAFEPAKSFKPPVAVVARVPTPPNPAPQPPATVVLNQGPAPAPPPPPPAQLPQINVPPLNLPPPPAPPQLPTPTATPTPTPPPPPAPPPPPGNAGALPLSLEAPLAPVSIVPTVIPPSPPPVNPAPPSGSAARKEARQRQAATAKSEEGAGDQQGAGEGQSSGDNGAAQMTRREPTRPAPSYGESSRDDKRYSFTALSHTEQPSAWSRGALYGGMTLATALALALGWGIARPTPRRRHPPRPAPGTVRNVGKRSDS